MSKEQLKELEKASRELKALKAGGVCNWDGYDFAMEEIHKEEQEEQNMLNLSSDILDAVILEVQCNDIAGHYFKFGVTKIVTDLIKAYMEAKE